MQTRKKCSSHFNIEISLDSEDDENESPSLSVQDNTPNRFTIIIFSDGEET